MSVEENEPIVITVEDFLTKSKIEYKVQPNVAKAIMAILEAVDGTTDSLVPKWDSGCRV